MVSKSVLRLSSSSTSMDTLIANRIELFSPSLSGGILTSSLFSSLVMIELLLYPKDHILIILKFLTV